MTHSWLALGTVVHMHVVCGQENLAQQAMLQAMEAMKAVEEACSRFDADSELVRLVNSPVGQEIGVSPILFQSLQFACEVARWTDGRFDPTVGARMDEFGFSQHYLTGQSLRMPVTASPLATFRDIELNQTNQTVRLQRPMRLDLGAVAKGMAVDLAAKELASFDFEGYVVDAGGDLYVAGNDVGGQAWTIGIRHPLHHEQSIRTVTGQNIAVCTSGTYERRSPRNPNVHHILDYRSRGSAEGYLSITAVGPYTLMADAFSTAAFLYPVDEALGLLEEVGLEAMIITTDLDITATRGMEGYLNESV